MAEFIHSTESSTGGPFLVERSSLESLDTILNEEWQRFKQRRIEDIEGEVEKVFDQERERIYNKQLADGDLRKKIREGLQRSYHFKERKEYFLHLKNGSVAKVPDFNTALRESDLRDQELTGFYIILESGDHSCTIELNGRYASLAIEVSPKENQLVQETLMVLRNWQNSVRPPKWQSYWLNIVKLGIVHWAVWLVACAISLTVIEEHAENAQIRRYSQEASQLFRLFKIRVAMAGRPSFGRK